MTFTPRTQEQIRRDMVTYTTSNSNQITDFNEGSNIRVMYDSISSVIEDIYFEVLLNWVSDLRTALQTSLGFARKVGVRASGNVVFSAVTATSSDINIPIGTIVETSDGTRYATTEAGIISAGQTTSGNVPIRAESVGISGNVGAGEVTVLVSSIAGVLSVNNAGAITGGVDVESDEDYNNRFGVYIRGLTRSTNSGITAGVLSVSGVSNTLVFNESVPGHVTIFIADNNGIADQALISSVRTLIEGDGSASNPGYRPAGILFNYRSTVVVDINLNITAYYTPGSDSSMGSELRTRVNTVVDSYINSLDIGVDVVLSQIKRAILNSIQEIVDLTINSPDDNVIINRNAGQIAKLGTLAVTYNEFVDRNS